MNLRSINLNLLPVLRALLREQSVLRASDSLGLSPSATSEALGRLRGVLGDPLLVQAGRGMKLTMRAAELIEPVERLCAELEDVLKAQEVDPKTVTRTFVIATLDYMALIVAKAFAPVLQEAAPGLTLQFVDLSRDVRERIVAGQVDLAIVSPSFWRATGSNGSGERLQGSPLMEDRFVVLFSQTHPLAAKPSCEPADLMLFPHVGFHMDWKHGQHALRPEGLNTPIRVQHHMLMPFLGLGSDYLAVVPESFARQVAPILPVEIRELPGPPATFRMFVSWGPIHHDDRTHRWFRQRLRKSIAGPGAQPRVREGILPGA